MPQLSALPRGMGRPVQVIAVTGGKGGVGKTSVSVNLAIALAQAGREVLLLDGDLGLANVDVLLGLTPKGTLEQVIKANPTFDYDGGYGVDKGPWTTDMFVAAVYRELKK